LLVKKAVIVKNFDDGVKDRTYGHCIVAGIERYPRKVIKRWSRRKVSLRSRLKPFIKLINYGHIMPTRYGLDIDLKSVVTPQVLNEPSKKNCC